MKLKLIIFILSLIGIIIGVQFISFDMEPKQQILRIGFFPNVTHAQGLIGYYFSKEKKDFFHDCFGKDIKLEWYIFNAGPSAMEALLANTIDITYVGPNPAINAYVKSEGKGLRIISGAALGGAALIVHNDNLIKTPSDFKGKTIATPQYGNTQDIACRIWCKKNGLNVSTTGGDVSILPTNNPDQLVLFANNKLDAVWTVEPWVSRLENETNSKVFLEQKDTITTLLVASSQALREKQNLIRKFVTAHKEITFRIKNLPEKMQEFVQQGLALCTKRSFPINLIRSAWTRINFTTQVHYDGLLEIYNDALSLGIIKEKIDLNPILDPL